MDFMREISALIEDKATVTVNWLSYELQISVRKAIELIQEFKSSKADSVATYRVVYRDECGGIQVATIVENELSQIQDLSLEILSHQIYSISKVNTTMNPTMIVEAALAQAEELLKTTTATQSSFLTNAFGEVQLSQVEIKAVGTRVFSAQNVLFKAPSVSEQALPPVPAMMKAPSLSTSATASSTCNKENKVSSSSSNTATVTQSATVKKIAKTNEEAAKKYFGAFVGAPNPLDPILQDRCVEGAGDDEEEWDDGQVKLATRQQVVKQVASDEVLEFSSQEADAGKSKAAEEDNDNSGTRKRKAKVSVLTRGAMDDYMEDIAIEEFKRKQEEEATGAPPTKKTKRVLVEKSFVDADGYFVTEMVWDEITDDESDGPAAKRALDKLAPTSHTTKENNPTNEMKRETSQTTKQPLKPKPQAKTTTSGVAQKSMMSFFTKK